MKGDIIFVTEYISTMLSNTVHTRGWYAVVTGEDEEDRIHFLDEDSPASFDGYDYMCDMDRATVVAPEDVPDRIWARLALYRLTV